MQMKEFKRMQFSPRSLEAFKRSGVLLQELVYPTLDMFADARNRSPDIANVKLEVALQGRITKFKALKKEYENVCILESEGKWYPNMDKN